MGWLPQRDDVLADMALQAIHDYWSAGQRRASASGVAMIFTPFCCAWNWDARPFPVFPLDASVWGDGDDWATGNWIGGQGARLGAARAGRATRSGNLRNISHAGRPGLERQIPPRFLTRAHAHVSGRELRESRRLNPLYDIDLTFDLLRDDADLRRIAEVIALHRDASGPGAAVPVRAAGRTGPDDRRAARNRRWRDDKFYLTREIGGYTETVQATIGAPTVYLNGVPLPSERLRPVDPAGDRDLRHTRPPQARS